MLDGIWVFSSRLCIIGIQAELKTLRMCSLSLGRFIAFYLRWFVWLLLFRKMYLWLSYDSFKILSLGDFLFFMAAMVMSISWKVCHSVCLVFAQGVRLGQHYLSGSTYHAGIVLFLLCLLFLPSLLSAVCLMICLVLFLSQWFLGLLLVMKSLMDCIFVVLIRFL